MKISKGNWLHDIIAEGNQSKKTSVAIQVFPQDKRFSNQFNFDFSTCNNVFVQWTQTKVIN